MSLCEAAGVWTVRNNYMNLIEDIHQILTSFAYFSCFDGRVEASTKMEDTSSENTTCVYEKQKKYRNDKNRSAHMAHVKSITTRSRAIKSHGISESRTLHTRPTRKESLGRNRLVWVTRPFIHDWALPEMLPLGRLGDKSVGKLWSRHPKRETREEKIGKNGTGASGRVGRPYLSTKAKVIILSEPCRCVVILVRQRYPP